MGPALFFLPRMFSAGSSNAPVFGIAVETEGKEDS